jgi:hypothetical protein
MQFLLVLLKFSRFWRKIFSSLLHLKNFSFLYIAVGLEPYQNFLSAPELNQNDAAPWYSFYLTQK